SEQTPVPVAEVSLDSDEVELLGQFVQDLRELTDSAFMKEGPGSLKTIGHVIVSPASNPAVETAVTDEEIRSFVTIFRKFYMEKEVANFQKAVAVFVKAVGDHPHGKLVEGTFKEYRNHLDAVPDTLPGLPAGTCTFTVKRLIDVFLYAR